MYTAVVCRTPDGPDSLALEQLPRSPLLAGQVRIAMRAAGLNFPDLLMSRNLYQLKPQLPFTPGMEGAGCITETGEGVTGHAVGDRVMFCAWHGCLAQEAIASAADLLPMPEDFSFAEAASFVVAVSTATNALLQRAALRPGETLLVHGAAGGVGLAAVQVGKLLGARVIATASNAEKLAVATGEGADFGIDYHRDNFRERVLEITAGEGADVILDTVGGEVFEQSMRCIAWGGRLLVVGFASGQIPQVRMNQPLLKCFSIVGVRALEHLKRRPLDGQAYRAWMLNAASQGKLRPRICATFPLQRFRDALALLENRQATGRVVVEMGPAAQG